MDFKVLIKEKFPELSNSQKKVAKYILDNNEEILFDTAAQLSRKVSVSESTVIRLSYSLGFKTFTEMKNEIREGINIDSNKAKQNIKSLDFKKYISIDEIIKHIKTQINNGDKAYENINFEEIEKICDLIMTKKKILILGYIDSFGVASELLSMLEKVRKDVYFYRLLFNEKDILYDMDEESLLLVISFSPHYKYSLEHTITAKKGGCTVVSITDSIITPFSNLSDYNLAFNLKRNSSLNLIDTSKTLKFLFLMFNYIYLKNEDIINKYRNSNNRRNEQFLE